MCHGCGRLQAVGDACRLTLTRVDVAVGVDSALLAARNYCERAAKELHAAGGRILPKDGRAPPTLQQQLEGLQAWHAFLATRLQVFKVPSFPPKCLLVVTATSLEKLAHLDIRLDKVQGGCECKSWVRRLLVHRASLWFRGSASKMAGTTLQH